MVCWFFLVCVGWLYCSMSRWLIDIIAMWFELLVIFLSGGGFNIVVVWF